jgi:hypothetical protein
MPVPAPRANGGASVPAVATPVGKIASAIASVMSQVGTIEKGGRNEYFGYKYARMEDLLHVVTPLMGKAGLAVIQNEIDSSVVEGNRLTILYEFSIFHSSGEVWPEKPRHRGMCSARDRKGNWDDKAVAKCHTNARKYFLLSLFQVPAGDFPDADDDDANQRQEKAPVPGPYATTSATASRMEREAELKPIPAQTISQQATAARSPQKIGLGQGAGVDQWANAYINQIKVAKSEQELKQWDDLNDMTLQAISDNYSSIYEMIANAVDKRLAELGAPPMVSDMPDPATEPLEAVNWVAEQLGQFKAYEAAEAWWNRFVAPREGEFDMVDWERLMGEWKRTEQRLLADLVPPKQQEPPAE